MDVSWIRQGLPSVNFVLLDILKTVFSLRVVKRVALLNTKIKQGQLHVSIALLGGILIQQLLPFAKAVSQVNFKTKLDKQVAKVALEANIKIMEQETIVLTAILVITALVGRLFVQSVPKGITKINMALQVVSLVVQENIKIKNPQKTVKVVLLERLITTTHNRVVKTVMKDTFKMNTVKQVARIAVQGFIQKKDMLIAKIAQLDNTKTKRKKVVANVAMDIAHILNTLKVRLPLAVNVENVKEQMLIIIGGE